MKLVGIDPGETTGVAVLDIGEDDLAILGFGQWNGMYELAEIVDKGFFGDIKVIAMERYIIYPHASMSHIGSSVYTAQEIGRVLWIAHRHDIAVYEQTASMAKGRWTDHRIKKYFDVRMTKDNRHCIDALRHALTCWERNFKDK